MVYLRYAFLLSLFALQYSTVSYGDRGVTSIVPNTSDENVATFAPENCIVFSGQQSGGQNERWGRCTSALQPEFVQFLAPSPCPILACSRDRGAAEIRAVTQSTCPRVDCRSDGPYSRLAVMRDRRSYEVLREGWRRDQTQVQPNLAGGAPEDLSIVSGRARENALQADARLVVISRRVDQEIADRRRDLASIRSASRGPDRDQLEALAQSELDLAISQRRGLDAIRPRTDAGIQEIERVEGGVRRGVGDLVSPISEIARGMGAELNGSKGGGARTGAGDEGYDRVLANAGGVDLVDKPDPSEPANSENGQVIHSEELLSSGQASVTDESLDPQLSIEKKRKIILDRIRKKVLALREMNLKLGAGGSGVGEINLREKAHGSSSSGDSWFSKRGNRSSQPAGSVENLISLADMMNSALGERDAGMGGDRRLASLSPTDSSVLGENSISLFERINVCVVRRMQ